MLRMAVLFYLVGLVVAVAARADEGPVHHHPPEHEKLHQEFYSKWQMPPLRSVSCCNLKDCYPTPIKFEDGRYWALRREDKKWIAIPEGVLEQNQPIDDQRESPDFQSHVCMPPPDTHFGDRVWCATIGSGQ